jgi:flagellar hook-length control protein FliK
MLTNVDTVITSASSRKHLDIADSGHSLSTAESHGVQPRVVTSAEINVPIQFLAEALVQEMLVMRHEGQHEICLSLRPSSLGQVHLTLDQERERWHGRLSVESPIIRAMMEGQLPILKSDLHDRGFHVEQFEVVQESFGERDGQHHTR